jgi:phage-related tail protein
LGSRGRQISEFEASLVYKVSSRTARAIQRDPVSEKRKKERKKTQKTTTTTTKNQETLWKDGSAVALSEDPCSIPNTYIATHNYL